MNMLIFDNMHFTTFRHFFLFLFSESRNGVDVESSGPMFFMNTVEPCHTDTPKTE